MKNVIVKTAALIAVAALAGATFAQNAGPRGGQAGGPGRQGGGMGMGRMMGPRMAEVQEKALTKAGATADQKAKVKALNEKNMKATRDFMKKEFNIDLPAPGARPAAGQRGQAGAGGQRGGGRVDWSKMTEEQRTKMRDFAQKQMQGTQAEMKKILGDKYPAFEKAMREEMSSLMGRRGGPGAPGGARGGQKPPRG